jgi:hypothetical protein
MLVIPILSQEQKDKVAENPSNYILVDKHDPT